MMSGSAFLGASVLALGSGPLLARLARPRPELLSFVDGFVVVAVGGLVLLDVVPHALERRDLIAALCMLVGFALPTIAERMLHYGVRQTHAVVLTLAMLGVVLHSALDGSALRQAGDMRGSMLGYGVLLHQLPVSLMVWWVLRDRPRKIAWLVLSIMAIMTVVGFLIEPTLLTMLPENAGLRFEALVGGSLLHVIAHPAHEHLDAHEEDAHASGHSHDHSHDHSHAVTHDESHAHSGHINHDDAAGQARGNWSSGLGALGGLGILAALHLTRTVRGEGALDATLQTLWTLSLESAPAVLLAYVFAGIAQGFFSINVLSWLTRGSTVRQSMSGIAVGLPLPICSCGVVPLYQQLVRQGAPTTAAIAFLIATPELGLDAVLISVPLLGVPFTVVRVVAAAAVALSIALLMGRMHDRHTMPRRALPLRSDAPEGRSISERLRMALHSGLGETVDHTAPWIVAGLLVAALSLPVLSGSWLTTLPAGFDVVVFALIGFPLYICASASTPLVAVLVATGVSPGAGLALLLTGPATNVATLGVLTRLHTRRFALTFALLMSGAAIIAGWIINLTLPALPSTQPALSAHAASGVEQLSLVLVVLLFTASLVRRGLRGFLGELNLRGGT